MDRFGIAFVAALAGASIGFFAAVVLGIVAGVTSQWHLLFIDGESAHVTLPLLGGGICFITAYTVTIDSAARIGISLLVGGMTMLCSWLFAGALWNAGLTNSWDLPGWGYINVYHILPVWGGPMGFLIAYCWPAWSDEPATSTPEPTMPPPSEQ